MVIGERRSGPYWSAHVGILDSLLRLRPIESLDHPDSRSLNHNAHAFLQMRNLTLRLPPSREAELRSAAPDRDLEMQEHGLLVCDTCRVLAKAAPYFRGQMDDINAVDTLLELVPEGMSVYENLVSWSESLTGTYTYTEFASPFQAPPDSPLSPPCNNNMIHIYSSISVVSLWNMHRICRILLLYDLKCCITALIDLRTSPSQSPPRLIPDSFLTFFSQIDTRIQDLVNQIYASIPYALGEIDQNGSLSTPNNNINNNNNNRNHPNTNKDGGAKSRHRPRKALGGFCLLFPLLTLVYGNQIDQRQKNWIIKRLLFIKNTLGIQKAMEPHRIE